MRAIEKLWSVVYTISEVRKITSSKEPCVISQGTFDPLKKEDVDKILRKLDKDERVINLIQEPESNTSLRRNDDPDHYKYIIGVNSNFENFFEETYRRYHQGIHKLGAKNFFGIFDLILDIEQEIEMSDTNIVDVELLKRVMRFNDHLFPKDSTYFRGAFIEQRKKSANYLKKQGAIKSFEVVDKRNRKMLQIELDAFAFDGFADKVKARYKNEFYENPTEPRKNQLDKPKRSKLTFDLKKPRPVLSFLGKKTDFSTRTIEYFILAEVFNVHPEVAIEDDIIDKWGGKENKQTLYDGTTRLNKKLNLVLGLRLDNKVKLLNHADGKFWLNDDYIKEIELLT